MQDDNALALAVPSYIILGRRGETVPEFLRAVMRIDVTLVHVDDDGGAILLLLQGLRVRVNVATDECVSVGARLLDEVLLAILISERMQPAVHGTFRDDDAELLLQFMPQRRAGLEDIVEYHFV